MGLSLVNEFFDPDAKIAAPSTLQFEFCWNAGVASCCETLPLSDIQEDYPLFAGPDMGTCTTETLVDFVSLILHDGMNVTVKHSGSDNWKGVVVSLLTTGNSKIDFSVAGIDFVGDMEESTHAYAFFHDFRFG